MVHYGKFWGEEGFYPPPLFDTAKICFDPFHIGHAQMVIRQMKVKSTLNQKRVCLKSKALVYILTM